MTLPRYNELFNATLQAMRQLGESASIAELDRQVAEDLRLTGEEVSQLHKNGSGTELGYRLAWTRTYLKAYGLVDSNRRGVWHLTPAGREVGAVDSADIVRFVRALSVEKKRASEVTRPIQPEATAEETWREVLLKQLVNLPADAFERLAQRILRESGFTQVNVTGRSGDGGIDGTGIVQLGGLLSFPVLFQCKRYRGSVGAGAIRDFRGAMVGRSDRGLIITTGSFTREARGEATRDGAPLIDLVDGEQLLDKLKELGLGVRVSIRTVEDVVVTPDFFVKI